jgi:hypothetical protein
VGFSAWLEDHPVLSENDTYCVSISRGKDYLWVVGFCDWPTAYICKSLGELGRERERERERERDKGGGIGKERERERESHLLKFSHYQ